MSGVREWVVSKGSRLTPTTTPPSGFPVREVGRGNDGMYFFGGGYAVERASRFSFRMSSKTDLAMKKAGRRGSM
jgi:hypothetical protein